MQLSGEHTEVCQYYAFFTGVATPESHPHLWKRLRDEFGPIRKVTKDYPDVPFANAFIGNYIRNELLSREGLCAQILDETVDFYLPHIAHILYRDILGVYNVSPTEKMVTLRIIDSGMEHCKGSIPVGEESVDVEWKKEGGKFVVALSLPTGYSYKVVQSASEVCVDLK